MAKRMIAPQVSVFMSFFIYALILGGIYPRLGDLQIQMGIGESILGAALLGAALGTQISLMFAGPLVERLGHRLIIILSIPLIGFAQVAATLSMSPVMFFFCLVFSGLAIGAIEIVVNLEADRTELMLGKRIMNRSHAFWSFGFFGAGLIGAAASGMSIGPTTQVLCQTLISSTAALIIFHNYTPAPSRSIEEDLQPKFVRPTIGIMAIVVFTLSAMLLEGASIDWSVIFMRDIFEVSPFINGLAFAAGALMQAITRFYVDGFVDRFGPIKVAKTCIAILGAGVLIVTFGNFAYLALVGFGLMGIGTSCIFPLAMSAAAQRTDRSAASNVASLAQFSFIVFLIGPPALGFLAEHFGIRFSFGIGIPLVVVSWFMAYHLVGKKPREVDIKENISQDFA
jgi:MFS family permease